MKLYFTALAFGLSVAALAGCGGAANSNVAGVNTNRAANAANNAVSTVANAVNSAANTVSNAVSTATTDAPDEFMKEAAQGGMAEVELGKLAATKATDPEVKKFGQMMVDEHTKANAELKALAGKKNVQLPADLGPHQSDHDELKNAAGADFDRGYVKLMVNDHESTVAAFQAQADNSSDPEVKAFAAKTLPTLKKHLEMIQAISSRINK